jgi:hypothetical protein
MLATFIVDRSGVALRRQVGVDNMAGRPTRTTATGPTRARSSRALQNVPGGRRKILCDNAVEFWKLSLTRAEPATARRPAPEGRMATGRGRWLLVLIVALALPRPGGAFVLGGGFADTDCTIAFGGVDANAATSGVVCVDGDPACDADGTADGACRFSVALCARVSAEGCGVRDVTTVRVDGLDLAEPPLDVDGACGASTDVTVAVETAAAATAVARAGDELKDVDYLNLCCVGAPGAVDAARCAGAVDLGAAGCHRVPAGVRRAFLQARRSIARIADGAGSPRLLRQARRALGRARDKAQRLAQRDA